MVKGLPLISVSLSRTCSLCWPRLMAVYDTSYREAEVVAIAACTAGVLVFCSFFDHGHRLPLVGVALEMSSS